MISSIKVKDRLHELTYGLSFGCTYIPVISTTLPFVAIIETKELNECI